MNRTIALTSLAVCVFSLASHAEEPRHLKYLDRFHMLDSKTLKGSEIKMKVVEGGDSEHARALELSADFARPEVGAHLMKTIPLGTIHPKRFTGLRFFIKSPTETRVGIRMEGTYLRRDGRLTSFHGGAVTGGNRWTEVKIPFSDFKRAGTKFWKDGVQVFVQGGDPIEEFEMSQLTRIFFTMSEETRGNQTVAKVLLEGLALVED